MSVVLFVTETPVASVPPKLTLAPAAKFVPVIVTTVPPTVGPLLGLTPLMLGGGGVVYVKALASVALCASGLVTMTETVPAACAGVVAVRLVPFVTVTFVASVPPMRTLAPATKLLPVIVTEVPPVVGPVFGTTLLTVGGPGETAPNVAT